MFDDFDLGLDDRDCSGNCDTCPYVDWFYPNSFDDPYPVCKLEEK